jgi:heme-degrading monooxygenase HmoA
MKQIFIDKFNVSHNAVDEFTERMNYNRSFLRGLPGFIEDAAYQRTDENGNLVIITVAQWESEDAVKNAKAKVQAEYQRIGFDMPGMMKRLNITMERGLYTQL